MPDLEDRVAALEEMVRFPLKLVYSPPMSDEDAAKFREELKEFEKASGQPYQHRVIQQPSPLTQDEIRQLLRECVTVVKPGETLVIRDRNWTPSQVREIQEWMDVEYGSGRISFKVLAIIGEELGVAETPGG